MEDLNFNALISHACDVGEEDAIRWEAYRLALKDFDWYYTAHPKESYRRDQDHRYLMLVDAKKALDALNTEKSNIMWGISLKWGGFYDI